LSKFRLPNHWLTVVLVFLLLTVCITYIVVPVDIIQDYRGWTGWIDDILVVLFCFVLSVVAILSILPLKVSLLLVVLPVLCVAYIVSPIDAFPDFLPIIGWLDDLVAALAGLAATLAGLKAAVSYSERTLPSVQIGMLRLRLPFRSPPFVDALKPWPVLGFAPLTDFRHPRRAARSIIAFPLMIVLGFS